MRPAFAVRKPRLWAQAERKCLNDETGSNANKKDHDEREGEFEMADMVMTVSKLLCYIFIASVLQLSVDKPCAIETCLKRLYHEDSEDLGVSWSVLRKLLLVSYCVVVWVLCCGVGIVLWCGYCVVVWVLCCGVGIVLWCGYCVVLWCGYCVVV